GESDVERVDGGVAACRVERFAGEGGDDFDLAKTGGEGGGFGTAEELATDAAPREIGMDEKRADHGWFGAGIARRVLAGFRAVAAVACFPPAPAAAADDPVVGDRDEVSAVFDELRVD